MLVSVFSPHELGIKLRSQVRQCSTWTGIRLGPFHKELSSPSCGEIGWKDPITSPCKVLLRIFHWMDHAYKYLRPSSLLLATPVTKDCTGGTGSTAPSCIHLFVVLPSSIPTQCIAVGSQTLPPPMVKADQGWKGMADDMGWEVFHWRRQGRLELLVSFSTNLSSSYRFLFLRNPQPLSQCARKVKGLPWGWSGGRNQPVEVPPHKWICGPWSGPKFEGKHPPPRMALKCACTQTNSYSIQESCN